MRNEEAQAACKAIVNISEEMGLLRDLILVSDADALMDDALFQCKYQELMVRGVGTVLGAVAMLLGDACES